MDAPERLTPQMTSRKLQAFGFIRRYIGEHGGSPSYGEIGAGLGVTRQRAYYLVRALEAEARLTRTPGVERSIRLVLPEGVPDIDAAIAQLRAAGFKVDEEGLGLGPGLQRAYPLTITELRMVPDLEQIGDVEVGSTSDEPSQRPRGGPRALPGARQRAREGETEQARPRAA